MHVCLYVACQSINEKQIARSQGKGIFLFDKLSQISDWKNDTRWNPNSGGGGGGGGAGASAPPPPPPQPATKPSASAAGGGGGGGSDDEAASDDDAPAANVGLQTEKYIVQRYIHNPLLVGGKKFDLRLYALVTSYQPVLNVYLYREGFARFSSARFTMDKGDVENSCMMVSIDRRSLASRSSRHVTSRVNCCSLAHALTLFCSPSPPALYLNLQMCTSQTSPFKRSRPHTMPNPVVNGMFAV